MTEEERTKAVASEIVRSLRKIASLADKLEAEDPTGEGFVIMVDGGAFRRLEEAIIYHRVVVRTVQALGMSLDDLFGLWMPDQQ